MIYSRQIYWHTESLNKYTPNLKSWYSKVPKKLCFAFSSKRATFKFLRIDKITCISIILKFSSKNKVYF